MPKDHIYGPLETKITSYEELKALKRVVKFIKGD